MSDFNTTIVTIDSGMDCFSRIQDAASQYDKVVRYDLSQLSESISERIESMESRLDYINFQLDAINSEDEETETSHHRESQALLEESDRLLKKIDQLNELQSRCNLLSERYYNQSSPIMRTIKSNTDDAIREMARYLYKIQDIEGFHGSSQSSAAHSFVNPFSNDSDYAVVIIDSSKYPETAEHIDVAIRTGSPAVLTLSRNSATSNRSASLHDVPVRTDFDRDEWPMACFSEGGADAHVFYLSASDNRGAGSAVSHQLRNIPDGTRVRFRIV